MRAERNLDHRLRGSSSNNFVRAQQSKISLLMKEQSDQGPFVCYLQQFDCFSLGLKSPDHQLEDSILEIWHILELKGSI